MSDARTADVGLSVETLNQSAAERIAARMELEATRRRATFDVRIGRDDVKGDAVNVSDRETTKAKVS